MAEPRDPRQQLQWQHLTRAEQTAVSGGMQEAFGPDLGKRMAEQSAKELTRAGEREAEGKDAQMYRNKGERLAESAAVIQPRQASQHRAAQNRVEAVRSAATTARTPQEAERGVVGGAGWYFEEHQKTAAVAPDMDPRKLITAGSVLSSGSTPAAELRALSELVEKQGQGGTGHARSGATSSKAAKVLSGEIPVEEAQDPLGEPKTWGYTEAKAQAVPGTDVEDEYMLRARNMGRSMRGEEVRGQGTLPLYGEVSTRDWATSDVNASPAERAAATAGRPPHLLDPRAPTAEDTWQQTQSQIHRFPDTSVAKAVGDVPSFSKTDVVMDEGGRPKRVKKENMPAGPSGALRHAWENKATQRAGEMIKSEERHDFDIPSILVQETGWTATKRTVTARGGKTSTDPAYNAAVRSSEQEEKRQSREVEAAQRQERSRQGSFFSGSGR